MELPANHFKRGIYAGEQQLGLWCSLASNLTVEILAGSGYDWLLIDTEHSPNELNMVFSQLQACMENKVQPIVRPPVTDAIWAKRYLDAGVQSFLFPMVETAEQPAVALAHDRMIIAQEDADQIHGPRLSRDGPDTMCRRRRAEA